MKISVASVIAVGHAASNIRANGPRQDERRAVRRLAKWHWSWQENS
jgi:hypothetical protein